MTMMHEQGMMMGPMKGHLAPNSSPFKPTINKLSSQYMIQDHMASHYIKLRTTKPAIDNKPPKSMTTSVKKRDQMRREAMAKQMRLFDFEKEMKHSSSPSHHQMHDEDLYGSQPRLLSVTVSKNGYDEMRPRLSSSYRSQHARPRSSFSPRSSTTSNPNSPRNKSQKADILNQTYSGDYLDRHEERFKNTDTPFTPRLKKRTGKSKLLESKHYAPPLVFKKENKRKIATKSPGSDAKDVSPKSSYSDLRSAQDRTPSRENERKWVEEQTDLMQRLTLDESKRTYDNIYPNRTSMSTDDYGFRQTGTGSTLLGSSSLGRTFIRSDTFSKNETKNRIQAEEEEMKYLEFINGVTNDILTRGIYSDRVLMQVMQRHMDQNRGRLNEGRMRHMLIKLQEDLGVPPDVSSRGFRTTSAYTSGYEEKSLDSSPKKRSGSPEGLKSASWKSDASSRSAASKLNFLASKHTTKPPVSTSSNASHSGKVKRQKGILKTPGTSSGSDMEAKYVTLSSGDEDEKKARQKKISVENEALTTNTLEENLDVKGTTHAIPCPSERTTSPTRPTPVKRSSIVSRSGSHIADSVSLDENQPDEVKSHNETPERTIPVTTKHGNISDGSDLDDF